MEPNASHQHESSHGYGKRPLWQLLLIYIIVGIVVYGLIYYFFMRSTGHKPY